MKEKVLQITQEIIDCYPTIRKWFRSLFTMKELPVTTTQLVCLMCVNNLKSTTMSNLASKMFMSNQQLTKLIDHLVKIDLIQREIVPHNRRQIVVSVTEKGTVLLKQLQEEVANKCADFLSENCDSEELTKLHLAVRVLAAFVEKQLQPQS